MGTELFEDDGAIDQSVEPDMREVAEQSTGGLCLVSRSGRVLQANLALAKLLRTTVEDLQGRRFQDFIIGVQSFSLKASGTYELPLRCPNGQSVWVRLSLWPVARNGSLLYYGCRVEDETRVVTTALGETTRTNSTLAMEATLEGMAVLENEVYRYLNPAHAEMYGWTVEELVGASWRVLYDAPMQRYVELVVFPALSQTGRWQGELTGRRRDGGDLKVEVSLTTNSDNIIVCCCRDITERVVQREALVTALEQRDELNV